MRSMVLLLTPMLAACQWVSAQPGDVTLALPCGMTESHVEAWADAAEAWAPAFPYRVSVVLCDAGARDQVQVDEQWVLPADLKGEWMATRQLGTNHANGCRIDIAVTVEKTAELKGYRWVAAHEVGHCLGLIAHSDDPKSIMFPAPRTEHPTGTDLAALRSVY